MHHGKRGNAQAREGETMSQDTTQPTPPEAAESDAAEAKPKRKRRAASSTTTKPAPKKTPPKRLPPWKVILHNDDDNEMLYVVETIMVLTPLGQREAVMRMLEAHERGKSLLLTTHRERAELYQEQFTSRQLTVTIEKA